MKLYFCFMGRILAFDYGTKRTGIAVTDPLQLIASGLKTVETSEILTFLEAYCNDEEVVLFVVGLPKQMNNLPSESEQFIKSFIRNLKRSFPEIPINREDERFTSKMALQSMIDSGIKKKQRQNKGMVDEISATLILQSYLNRK